VGLVPVGAGLQGVDGASATVYASGLPNASAFALDASGRLWVATSAASGHRADGVFLVRGGKPVKVLSARAPLGLTWHGGELYVASDGRVDAYRDLRGSRFAQHRVVLREPAGHGSNDGIVALPDGRMAMGISAACDHCAPKSMWSGTVVSFRPDGSDARVYANGIRAPFGLALDPAGGLLASMNQRDDLGARTPGDWLARVKEGQDWRFPECYGQCADAPKPLAVLDKHAAAGAVALDGGAALVTEWATGRVLRVDLKTGAVTLYLTGVSSPLPLIRTRDGAVLVGDWKSGRVYRVAR
jgi:glucose/arabinose dehydrogenase